MSTTTAIPPHSNVLQEYADNRGATLRVDRAGGHHPRRQALGDRQPQGPRVSAAGHGQGPAAVRRHAGQRRSRRSGPAAEPAGPHRPGQERDAQGRRPVRRLPFQPQAPLAEQIAWDAENAPQNLGFSHDTRGAARNQGGRLVVESIDKVLSRGSCRKPRHDRGLVRIFRS